MIFRYFLLSMSIFVLMSCNYILGNNAEFFNDGDSVVSIEVWASGKFIWKGKLMPKEKKTVGFFVNKDGSFKVDVKADSGRFSNQVGYVTSNDSPRLFGSIHRIIIEDGDVMYFFR